LKKQLSKSDIAKINDELQQRYDSEDFFGKKDPVVLVKTDAADIIVKDNAPLFFYHEGNLVPTLKFLLENQVLKKVVVDRGAVKFMSSGADVMRPGITEIDESIQLGEYVVIVDETHGKPLCVAKAKISGKEMQDLSTGKVFKNVHWVGDKIWTAEF